MIYRNFGKTNWQIGAVGMGTWNIGNQWGAVSDSEAFEVIRAGFDAGINLFDTSDAYGIPYGLSEQRLGVALKGIRHRAYIVSKCGLWGARTGLKINMGTPDMVRLCVHASMHRLNTDYIDVMLCHEPEIEDPSVYLEAFEMMKKSGEIREYGISTNNIEVLKRFNADGKCAVLETDYSVLNRNAESEILPYCIKHNIAVMARGPLAQGILAGKFTLDTVFDDNVRKSWNKDGKRREFYENGLAVADKLKAICESDDIAKTAVRYTISHPSAPVAIPGAKSPRQASGNAAAGAELLTDDIIKKIQNI